MKNSMQTTRPQHPHEERAVSVKTNPSDKTVYFADSRLFLSSFGRLSVRVISYISWIVLAVLDVVLLFSDVSRLRWAGLFLALVCIDRLRSTGQAERSLLRMPKEGRVNLAPYLSPKAFAAIERAFDQSVFSNSNFFLELTGQLLRDRHIIQSLRRLDVSADEFLVQVDEFISRSRTGAESTPAAFRLRSVEAVALNAFVVAVASRHASVEPTDLFAALGRVQDELTSRLFVLFDISPDDVRRAALFSTIASPARPTLLAPAAGRPLRHRVLNRAWTSRATLTLDQFGVDLTDQARAGLIGFLVGHESEYGELLDVVSRPIHPNALLVGDAGSGKETIVGHLAYCIVHDSVPPALFDRRLVSLNISLLVSGAPAQDVTRRVQEIVREIIEAGNIILYIPDIHNLLKTSAAGSLSAADAFAPIFSGNAFPVIGATYPREYAKDIQSNSAFSGVFDVIGINEISVEEATDVALAEAAALERRYKIFITFAAVKRAVGVAKKYFHTKLLPGSAVELLKEAVVRAQREGAKTLDPETVSSVAEEKAHMPVEEARGQEAQMLLNLEERIHEHFVNQDEAVTVVAQAIREYRAGLSTGRGPIASFLFVGPTGVGKTQLAKTLAALQFGSQDFLVRFDMSEYKDKQSFFRLIGSPDQQVSGSLTEAVREKPYCLLLLDEFEKAHPDILDLFLQVFDEGRLTDNLGRTVDFTNTIIIATSNAHSDIVNEALRRGESMSQIADYLKSKLTDIFKAELLNRFSRIVVFRNLTLQELTQVATLNLQEFATLMGQKGITLSFDSSVAEVIARHGLDPVFGARRLREVVEDMLRAPLAQMILKKEINRGDKITLGIENGELVIR